MTTLVDILVLGTLWGSLYSLISVGFTLIFGVAGIINLAHGAFYMLGAYLGYAFMSVLGLPVVIGGSMAVVGTSLVGMAVDRFCIKPMRENHAYVLLITLALALLFQELMYVFFGPHGKAVKEFLHGELILGNVRITYQKLFTMIMAWSSVVALWLFIKKTRTGKSVAAVAQNVDAAILVGIQPQRVYLMTMGISAALAGMAGVLIAPILEAVPNMWAFPLFKAFAVVIIGGLGSVEGAILSAMLLGYTETLVSRLISANYPDMVYLVAIIAILVFRPKGLLGRRAY